MCVRRDGGSENEQDGVSLMKRMISLFSYLRITPCVACQVLKHIILTSAGEAGLLKSSRRRNYRQKKVPGATVNAAANEQSIYN